MTIKWLLLPQQLQRVFMQSLAKLWLHSLQLHMLSKDTAFLPLAIVSIFFILHHRI
jgi:hypothetical protein